MSLCFALQEKWKEKNRQDQLLFFSWKILSFFVRLLSRPITHSFIVVFHDEYAVDRHLFLLAKRPEAWETQETETKAGYESRQPIKVHVRIKEKKKNQILEGTNQRSF